MSVLLPRLLGVLITDKAARWRAAYLRYRRQAPAGQVPGFSQVVIVTQLIRGRADTDRVTAANGSCLVSEQNLTVGANTQR